MGFAGFITSGVTPAVAGALRGRNLSAQQAEEQRRYEAQQAQQASGVKWERQQAIEAAQRQAMLDALAQQAQSALVKSRAEGNAIDMYKAQHPTPPSESYETFEGPQGMGLYGITEGKEPRFFGKVPSPAASSNGAMRNVTTLRKEYNSFVKPYEGLAQAYRKVRGAAQDPSAAGDLSVIFGYMKLLDPPSVVREGEQASAANARGVPETVRALYNRVLTGERLTPAQRKDFVHQASNLLSSQRAALQSQIARYRFIAEANGVDPEQVTYDPFDYIDDPALDESTAQDAGRSDAPSAQATPSATTTAQSAYEAWKAKQGRP